MGFFGFQTDSSRFHCGHGTSTATAWQISSAMPLDQLSCAAVREANSRSRGQQPGRGNTGVCTTNKVIFWLVVSGHLSYNIQEQVAKRIEMKSITRHETHHHHWVPHSIITSALLCDTWEVCFVQSLLHKIRFATFLLHEDQMANKQKQLLITHRIVAKRQRFMDL